MKTTAVPAQLDRVAVTGDLTKAYLVQLDARINEAAAEIEALDARLTKVERRFSLNSHTSGAIEAPATRH
ncbi:MAG: hypothetical protein ABI645_00480 [Pseudomonadota bacterium]